MEHIAIPSKKEMEEYWRSTESGKYAGYHGLDTVEDCHLEIEDLYDEIAEMQEAIKYMYRDIEFNAVEFDKLKKKYDKLYKAVYDLRNEL